MHRVQHTALVVILAALVMSAGLVPSSSLDAAVIRMDSTPELSLIHI